LDLRDVFRASHVNDGLTSLWVVFNSTTSYHKAEELFSIHSEYVFLKVETEVVCPEGREEFYEILGVLSCGEGFHDYVVYVHFDDLSNEGFEYLSISLC